MFSEWPPALIRKWILLALIGIVCLAVGVVMLVAAHDLVLLYISMILAGLTATRCVLLYRRIGKREYETVEGVCVSSAWTPIQRRRKVCLLTDDGEERAMTTDSKPAPKIGRRYRAYFLSGAFSDASGPDLGWISRPQVFVLEELEAVADNDVPEPASAAAAKNRLK